MISKIIYIMWSFILMLLLLAIEHYFAYVDKCVKS